LGCTLNICRGAHIDAPDAGYNERSHRVSRIKLTIFVPVFGGMV
jgi:hypothetical protein